MLIATEGPMLEDTKCSAVICQACIQFCGRPERLNFKYISTGLFFFADFLDELKLKTFCNFVYSRRKDQTFTVNYTHKKSYFM